MVDSPAVPPSTAKPAQNSAVSGEQSAKIITLPDSLQAVARARRVEGEILRQNPDGSTRIKTTEGNIDVQLRGRVPETGARVQVDIPAGAPPRQVTVRPAPPAQQPQAPQPAQPAPPQQPPAQTAPPPASVQPQQPPQPAPARPLPAAPGMPLPPTGQTQTAPPPVTMPLPENAVVRLLPATQAQIQQAVQQTLAQLTAQPAAITQTAFTANLVAQSAPDNLITQLLNLVRAAPATPAAPSTPALTTPPPGAPAITPGANFLSQPVLPQAHIVQPPLAAPLSAAPSLPAGTAANISFQPSTAFFTPAVTTGMPSPAQPMAVLDGTIIKITPPGVQAATPSIIATPGAAPGAITATVIGTMAQGQPLVSFPGAGGAIQHAILQFPASNLPIGTQLQIMPNMAAPPPAISASANTGAPAPLLHTLPLLQGVRWPALTETLHFLQQAEPALAGAMAKALPSPASPRGMPAAALLFLAAARAGDLSAWLGERKIDTLQRLGRGNLLGRLTGDGQQMARLSAEPLSASDWRAVPLPMFWQSEIEKIMLYFKRDEESQRDQGDGEQTRFIFDLSLSRIGEMQIDGLMRGKRLDLIVRSQSPFSQSMQAHMKQLYHSAIDDVSLTGDLSFQGDARQWVHVLQKEEQYRANI